MNKQLTQQIQTIEKLITDTKATLKTWANQIDQYHTQLKALTQQLDTIKKELNTNMRDNNSTNPGGKK